MAPLAYIGYSRQVLLFSVLLFLFVSVCFGASLSSYNGSSRRMLLEFDSENEDSSSSSYEPPPPLKKKSSKNNTKLIKPSTTTTKINNNLVSPKNQTKTIKSNNNLSTKNQTKLAKTKLTTLTDTGIKKLNSSNSTLKTKKLNSTSKSTNTISSSSSKKLLDPSVKSSAKNKTTKATANKDNEKVVVDQTEPNKKTSTKKQSPPSSNFPFEQDENDDVLMLSEFKDLPIRFQKALLPDLERISTTSKAYITKANKEFTKGFKPYVGNKYAPTIATLLSCAFALIPLLLVSLLFNRIKAYFSLQKLLIFIQAYLSIYFSILSLSSFITGLEPLRFFYSTSQSTYVCLQVLQTLAYVFYLLLLVMYLVLVFSTDCGLGSRFLGLAQTFVGFAVGLHYYMTVFHRVVLRQAPKTNWKVHGIYATCFFVICLVARADRRKKTYLEEGGDEGKKN